MKAAHQSVAPETAEYRSNLYRLFSLVYLHEVTPEFLNALTSEECMTAFEDCGAGLRELVMDKDHDRLLEELAEEYTAFFIAPRRHPSL